MKEFMTSQTHQTRLPVCTSNIWAVLLHPVAKYFPSLLNLTQQTTVLWSRLCCSETSVLGIILGLNLNTQAHQQKQKQTGT